MPLAAALTWDATGAATLATIRTPVVHGWC